LDLQVLEFAVNDHEQVFVLQMLRGLQELQLVLVFVLQVRPVVLQLVRVLQLVQQLQQL
jgi:hypothetical protein